MAMIETINDDYVERGSTFIQHTKFRITNNTEMEDGTYHTIHIFDISNGKTQDPGSSITMKHEQFKAVLAMLIVGE
jgi:hypothetical protein